MSARVSLVLVAALLASTLGGPDPAAARAPAPASAPSAAAPQLRVGTFNLDRDRAFPAWRRAVVTFRREVDVAGFQEVSSRAKRRFLAAGARWGYYGSTPGPDENPVVWDRRDLRGIGARAVRIAPSSYATLVRLRHRATGERYAVLNVHLVWGTSAAVDRLRLAQVRGLARAAERQRAAGYRVLALGDFNIDHRADRRTRRPGLPARALGAVGLVSAWESGLPLRGTGSSTLGAGFVDNVWSTRRARSVRALQRVSGGQHHPVIARYALPTRR